MKIKDSRQIKAKVKYYGQTAKLLIIVRDYISNQTIDGIVCLSSEETNGTNCDRLQMRHVIPLNQSFDVAHVNVVHMDDNESRATE